MATVDELLADVPNEGEKDPFEGLGEKTPSDSPTEKKPGTGEPKEGEHTPDQYEGFHKHPRWIAREKELEELKAREQENAKIIAELAAFKEEQSNKQIDTSVPDWFRELYGDNQIAWKKYNEHEQAKEQAIEQRLLERQEQSRQQQETEVSRWNKWVDSEVAKLESEGAKFDRNELIKVMVDYAPTTDNSYDFRKGYKIYEALKGKPDTAHSQARKELADTTTKVSGEPQKKDYQTTATMRRRSWGNLLN